MEDKNEIQRTESPLTSAVALAQADNNIDVAKLTELFSLQERWEANEAKKAYTVAMAEFKKNPPEIFKDQTVSFGDTRYNHASLNNVTTLINKALSEHGLTASWSQGQDNNAIKVTCKITHILGHSDETSLSAPPDKSGKKNDIQAIGSTVTYLQRYTLLALTGLATRDQDDDGAGADQSPPGVPRPTEQEQEILDAICKKLPQIKGKKVNGAKVAAILYAAKGAYPSQRQQVGPAAEYLVKKNKPEMYVNATKAEAEKQKAELAAVEEAERTAKEKFGKETEEPEPKYVCDECEEKFVKPKPNGLCPACLSDKIHERETVT
jgi:rubrerythrin